MAEETKESTAVSNDEVKVEISREPGCQVTFEIEVSPKATQAAYSKAVKTINKEVSLPGFRKGKAPAAQIISKFSGHVDKEWQDLVTNTAYKESLELTKIYPLGQESIKGVQVVECDKEKGAKVKIEFESFPEVPEADLEDLSVEPAEPKPVDDELFNKALEEMREVYLSFEDEEGRPVEKGDYVDLDIDAVEEDHTHNLCRDRLFHVEEEKMGQWMQDLVIGKNIGDEVEGESEWEESSGLPEEDFTPTKCKITIKKVKRGVLPETDEALAEKAGLDSAEELHKKLREDLTRRMEADAEKETKERVQTLLLEKFAFDTPKSLTEQEKNWIFRSKLVALQKEKLSQELIEKKREELEEISETEAEAEVRMLFLSQKLGQEYKLEILMDELQMELQRQMYMVPEEERIVDAQQMQPEQIRQRLFQYLMKEKVKAHLAVALVKEKA